MYSLFLLVRPRLNQTPTLINRRKSEEIRLVKAEGMHYWEKNFSRERERKHWRGGERERERFIGLFFLFCCLLLSFAYSTVSTLYSLFFYSVRLGSDDYTKKEEEKNTVERDTHMALKIYGWGPWKITQNIPLRPVLNHTLTHVWRQRFCLRNKTVTF